MKIIEWKRDQLENIGTFTPDNTNFLNQYIYQRGFQKIMTEFWNPTSNEMAFLNFCVLTLFWWKDLSIKSARIRLYQNPEYKADYIFDKDETRLVINLRSPDIMGEHWLNNDTVRGHLHLNVGSYLKGNKIDISKRTIRKRYHHMGMLPYHYDRSLFGNVRIMMCIKQK